jgi:hypothetical protein
MRELYIGLIVFMSQLTEAHQLYFPGMHVVYGSRGSLVHVPPAAVLKCIDDRPVNGFFVSATDKFGPALQGASLGHAYLAAVTEERGLVDGQYFERILDLEIANGVRPGVHDIDPIHCKHAALTLDGEFGGPSVTMSKSEILEILRSKGGVELKLNGGHKSKILRVNAVSGTTLEADRSAYNFDEWWAATLGLNLPKVLDNLFVTASLLGVKTVEVIE